MRYSKLEKCLGKYPTITETLLGEDPFHFVPVASHFIQIDQSFIKVHKHNGADEYLYSALPSPSIPGTWEVLWTSLY